MITETTFDVDNKKVVVIDGAFTFQEIAYMYAQVTRKSFVKCNEDSVLYTSKNVDLKWSSEISYEEELHKMIMQRYVSSISDLKNTPFQLGRQYVNYSTFETVDVIHEDAAYNGQNYFTVLQYANFKWEPNWHGETVFYNSDLTEIVHSVMIKPGRIVFFDASLPHSARTPSKIVDHPRYTIASKLILNKSN